MNEETVKEGETPRGYDREVHHLRARAVEMGRWAVTMVHDGWEAFRTGDLNVAQAVLDRDTQLDHFDEELEHEVIAFLVLRRPAAKDLRTAAAILKISTHLDRIGRLGFDIARITTSEPGIESPELAEIFGGMEQLAESMVVQSLDALEHEHEEEARQVIVRDDEVDRRYRQATRLLVREVVRDPVSAAQLSSQMLLARHLERIADNACKTAEKTIYAITGKRRSEYLARHPYRPYVLERRGQ